MVLYKLFILSTQRYVNWNFAFHLSLSVGHLFTFITKCATQKKNHHTFFNNTKILRALIKILPNTVRLGVIVLWHWLDLWHYNEKGCWMLRNKLMIEYLVKSHTKVQETLICFWSLDDLWRNLWNFQILMHVHLSCEVQILN